MTVITQYCCCLHYLGLYNYSVRSSSQNGTSIFTGLQSVISVSMREKKGHKFILIFIMLQNGEDIRVIERRKMSYFAGQFKYVILICWVIVADPGTQAQIRSIDCCAAQSSCVVYEVDADSFTLEKFVRSYANTDNSLPQLYIVVT